ESLVAEAHIRIEGYRRLAAVATVVGCSARTRRAVAHGTGDECHGETKRVGGLALRQGDRAAHREQIAVAASGNRLAAARATRLDARTVAVRRAATGDRRLDARADRRVARSSVTRCAGTADRRLVAVSGGRVARRHGARVRRDAHLLARLARMGGEVAR